LFLKIGCEGTTVKHFAKPCFAAKLASFPHETGHFEGADS